jgi:hypothetical protein
MPHPCGAQNSEVALLRFLRLRGVAINQTTHEAVAVADKTDEMFVRGGAPTGDGLRPQAKTAAHAPHCEPLQQNNEEQGGSEHGKLRRVA